MKEKQTSELSPSSSTLKVEKGHSTEIQKDKNKGLFQNHLHKIQEVENEKSLTIINKIK